MAIPLATTTITVRRVPDDEDLDPYDEQPEPETVASGVRAHISTRTGRETVAGGSQEVVSFGLSCDPVDLRHTDEVVDDTTGETFEVVWAISRQGLGMDHVQAGLERVTGVVSGGGRLR